MGRDCGWRWAPWAFCSNETSTVRHASGSSTCWTVVNVTVVRSPSRCRRASAARILAEPLAAQLRAHRATARSPRRRHRRRRPCPDQSDNSTSVARVRDRAADRPVKMARDVEKPTAPPRPLRRGRISAMSSEARLPPTPPAITSKQRPVRELRRRRPVRTAVVEKSRYSGRPQAPHGTPSCNAAGDVLDAFHELDERRSLRGHGATRHRSAHDQGGDTVAERGSSAPSQVICPS